MEAGVETARTKRRRIVLVASATERARAFARARRHTMAVKSLRLLLPAVALGCLAVYGATLYATSGLKGGKISVAAVKIDPTNLTMDNPKYNGFAKDGAEYRVRAREAVTDLKMSGPVRLNLIDGDLVQTSGVVINLKAKWGTFDQKKDLLELYERIDVAGTDGMKARLTRATVYTKENRIVSAQPVWAENATGTIRAAGMDVQGKTRKAAFRKDVEVTMKPSATAAARAAEGKPARASPLGLAGTSSEPLVVTAERLDVDDNAHTSLFRENVVARQGEARLEAPELDVLYEGRATLAGGAPPAKVAGDTPAEQTRLKTIHARGGVVMTSKADRAESQTMDYDAATEQVRLAGNVVMTQAPDRQVTAAAALLDQKADTVLLTGGVVINQARNVMKAERVSIDRKAGTARLATPGNGGRISTLLYQGSPDKPAVARPKAESPAEADAGGFGLMGAGFKSDPNQPIDVEAARLDIFDRKHRAIYTGKVVASQGDFVVNTEEMTAHYTGETGIASDGETKREAPRPKDKAKAKGQGVGGAELTRIEARKGVVVTGKDGQKVTGEWANFDVKSNQVVIGGKVEVTQPASPATPQKQQTVRLPEHLQLVMDLTSGVTRTVPVPGLQAPGTGAQTTSSFSTAVSAAPGGAGVPNCPKGAVCRSGRLELILYPNQIDKSKATVGGTTIGAPGAAPSLPRKPARKSPATVPEDSSWSQSVTGKGQN